MKKNCEKLLVEHEKLCKKIGTEGIKELAKEGLVERISLRRLREYSLEKGKQEITIVWPDGSTQNTDAFVKFVDLGRHRYEDRKFGILVKYVEFTLPASIEITHECKIIFKDETYVPFVELSGAVLRTTRSFQRFENGRRVYAFRKESEEILFPTDGDEPKKVVEKTDKERLAELEKELAELKALLKK